MVKKFADFIKESSGNTDPLKSIDIKNPNTRAETTLLDYGISVFGEESKFRGWMGSESPVLGARPIDLISDQRGIDRVVDELISIEHGLFT